MYSDNMQEVGEVAGDTSSRATVPGGFGSIIRRPKFFIPATLVMLLFLMALVPSAFAGWFGNGDPRECGIQHSGLPPTSGHPFGFDIQGCDLYANVVHGTRASITIALITTALSLVIAVVLGSMAGYLGGSVDAVISRTMDVFLGFPSLVGMIVVLQSLGSHNVWSVSLVLALFSWPISTRVMRSSVLSVRNLDYISASRGLGAGPLRIIVRHIIPNSITPLAVLASLSVGAVITAESALTFLGVGLRSPSISWGVQLNTAQEFFTTDLHLLLFPAAFLSVAVTSFVLLGDCLRDALDPTLR